MRVLVSVDKCIASGMCALASPTVFTQSDADGSVEVLSASPSLSVIRTVREAVKNCPAQVFTLEDEENTAEITIIKEA